MILRILSISFVLFLFLPLVDRNTDFFPEVSLSGAEKRFTETPFTMETWLDGSYQQAMNYYRERKMGLRSYLVKTFNQIHYTLFNRITGASGGRTDVVIGKDNWLYEKAYITKMGIPSGDKGYAVTARAERIKSLQEYFRQKGIPFIFILAPSKPEIYPDQLPDNIPVKTLPSDRKTDYQYLLKSLNDLDVTYIDCSTLFQEEKKRTPYHLFSPSGTHWNKYGAYLVWKEIIDLVQDDMKTPLSNIHLDKVIKKPIEGAEADLARLLNVWYNPMLYRATFYPEFNTEQNLRQKPSILMIGDSFLFTLVDIIEQADLSHEVDAWYYFNTHFHYTVHNGRLLGLDKAVSTPLDRGKIDWQKEVLKKDLIILIETKQWLPEIGFGFLESASLSLQSR